MPKSSTKKRRRHHQQGVFASSVEVLGVADPLGRPSKDSNSIENCLEQLEELSGVREVRPANTAPAAGPIPDESLTISVDQPSTNNHGQGAGPVPKKAKLNEQIDDKSRLWGPSLISNAEAASRFPSKRGIDIGVRKWDTAMRLWMTRGSYDPILLPCSLEVEVARHFRIEKLSSFLLKSCPTKQLKMPAFERWLIDSKVEELERIKGDSANNLPIVSCDPVLSYSRPHYGASMRLADEMKQTGMAPNAVNKTLKELCRQTGAAVDELQSHSKRYARKVPLKAGDRILLEKHDQIFTLLFHCKKWKKPFCIRIAASHYHKLRELFLRVHDGIRFMEGGKVTRALHAFHYLVMTVLLRYSSLSGGQLLLELRGGGMQGAIHSDAFHVLRKRFSRIHHGPMLECFASPLNCYIPCFCSAFPELDFHFGAIGSFLDVAIDCGVCEANPPFSAGIMDAMVDQIEHCIQEADRNKKCLAFVVVVPTILQDVDNDSGGGISMPAAKRQALSSFQRMTNNPNCTRHIILKAREHGYIEGSQHLRLTRYKSSIFDTSVVILQSRRSVRKIQLDDEQFEKDIRQAFASRCSSDKGQSCADKDECDHD